MTLFPHPYDNLSRKPRGSRKKHELLPDFLIIGAGKCGTTSLYYYLKQHPEIFVPARKEPNFYGYEQKKIADFRGDEEQVGHFMRSITTLNDYLALFEGALPAQIKGEVSNTYLYHRDAPYRIRHYNPDMKLVAILRQPAARLYSRYLHLARDNRLPTPAFTDCFDRQSIWWKRNDLIREGFYYNHLLPYYGLFPRENMRVYLYEEFSQHTTDVLRNVFTFLDVDPSFLPDLRIRYNQSGIARNKLLHKLYGHSGIAQRTLRTVLPHSAYHKLKSNVTLQRILTNLRALNMTRPQLAPEIKHRLTHEVYGEDIRKLQELIGKDLSHWLD